MGLPQKKPGASNVIHPKRGAARKQQQGRSATPPKVVVLNKGDVLFKEGERSRGMYILQEGSLRLYKKKGQGFIELAVIHSGEVIGELAFFDGEPRSASAEALTSCKLIMVSFEQMEKQLGSLPNWLTSLIQSVVKRLRAASTKVKQLESSSVSYYGNQGGPGTYLYLMLPDVLKFMAAMVLVAARHGEENSNGHVIINPETLQNIASKMLGAPISKLMDFLDILQDENMVKLQKTENSESGGDSFQIVILNLKQFEVIMHFINKEYGKDETKRIRMSKPCLRLGRSVYEYIKDREMPETESLEVSVKAAVEKMHGPQAVEVMLTNDNWAGVVKAGWGTGMDISKDGTDVVTMIKHEDFLKSFPAMSLLQAIDNLNEKKRESG